MGKEYRHLRALRQQLENHTNEEIKDNVLRGMDFVRDTSSPDIKAQWADEITKRLDKYLDEETRIKVREKCACIISNEKSIYAQTFRKLRKQHLNDADYLTAVVDYLNSTAPLLRCGEVSLDGDIIITVLARNSCECSALKNGLTKPISVTWCHCCKGSILSVVKHIFPKKECRMTIKETIASGGKVCTLLTTFE